MVALERLEGQRVDGEGVHAAPRELVPAPINAVAPGQFERSPEMYPSGADGGSIEQRVESWRGLAGTPACGLVSSSRGPE